MISALLLLALGIACLLAGGDFLVRGASGLARSLGVSSVIIGLTVVAFGTSAPELAVNLTAVVTGRSDIAFGNVVGSNLANVGLVLGCTAMLKPIRVRGSLLVHETPMMLLSMAVTLALAADRLLAGRPDGLDRGDGVVLLLLFVTFLYASGLEVVKHWRSGAREQAAEPVADPVLVRAAVEAWRNAVRLGARRPAPAPVDPLVEEAARVRVPGTTRSVLANLVFVGVGLLGLVYGGRWTVEGASSVALLLGVPHVIVGLFVVAVGTSLPELATALIAVGQGEEDIAVGNVVGSNIFNVLLVLGASASVHPFAVPRGGLEDLVSALVLSGLILPMALRSQRRITRGEGALLLAFYAAYSAHRFLGAG